jgi:hypothetical protein
LRESLQWVRILELLKLKTALVACKDNSPKPEEIKEAIYFNRLLCQCHIITVNTKANNEN